MRQLIALLILAIMLVSHGGMQGNLPHNDAIHDHASQGETPMAASEDAVASYIAQPAGANHTGELAHHAHTHLALGMPGAEVVVEGRLADNTTFGAADASRLAGREPAPLTQPPSA